MIMFVEHFETFICQIFHYLYGHVLFCLQTFNLSSVSIFLEQKTVVSDTDALTFMVSMNFKMFKFCHFQNSSDIYFLTFRTLFLDNTNFRVPEIEII